MHTPKTSFGNKDKVLRGSILLFCLNCKRYNLEIKHYMKYFRCSETRTNQQEVNSCESIRCEVNRIVPLVNRSRCGVGLSYCLLTY